MPLKTKKSLPVTKLGHNLKPNTKKVTVPGRTFSKQGNGPKKQEKKTPRTKAGYSLYSSDSSEQHTSNSRTSAQNTCAKFTTLVEDWMTHQSDSQEAYGLQNTQARDVVHDRTPFNRRLVSSTPDPGKHLEEMPDDEQLIPERDTRHLAKAGSMEAPSKTHSGNMQFGAVLTDSHRQQVRQQIDAILLAEGYEELKLKQQQESSRWQKEVPAERNGKSIEIWDTNGGSQKKTYVSSSKLRCQNRSNPPTANSRPVDLSLMSAAATWQHMVKENTLQTRGSDIGVFHHFLHRDSSASGPPSAFVQDKSSEHVVNSGQVFVPQSDGSFAPNISTGFTPASEEKGISTHTLASSLTSSSSFQPLSVKIDSKTGDKCVGFALPDFHPQPGLLHVPTPACSPLKLECPHDLSTNNIPQKKALSLKDSGIKSATVQEMETPCSIPELSVPSFDLNAEGFHVAATCVGDLPSPRSRAILGRGSECALAAGSNNPSLGKHLQGTHTSASKMAPKQKVDSAENYTCDGYFINRSEQDHIEDISALPTPRAYIPTPMHSPDRQKSELEPLHCLDVHLNKNNNSDSLAVDYCEGHGEQQGGREIIGRKTLTREGLAHFMLQFPGQIKSVREALADDFEESTCTNSSATEDDHDEMEPQTPACTPVSAAVYNSRDVINGPRRLRHLMFELHQTCAIDGDLEICQLIQEISNLIESLPQLKITFNLQAEIDLAMQPLRTDNSQLRRRLRILNQQLKERERREREGCSPGMEFEMLNLQTENASLLRQLKEERDERKKLSQHITEQQRQTEKANKELQLIKAKMSEMEHGKLIERQEQTQGIKGLHQELEMMSRRNESLQMKLASADRENSILHLNIRQQDMEIARLQTILGNLKQGVCDVLQFFDQNVGSHDTTDIGLQKLLSFLKASSQAHKVVTPDLTLADDGLIDQMGNNCRRKEQRPNKTGDDGDHSKKPKTNLLPSPLTIAALAAHNEHQKVTQVHKANLSFHSWDGARSAHCSPADTSLPYHSDPESLVFPRLVNGTDLKVPPSHQRKADDQNKGLDKHGVFVEAKSKQKESVCNSESSLESVRPKGHFETIESPSIDVQDRTLTQDAKELANCTRYSITDYFKKYPASRRTTDQLDNFCSDTQDGCRSTTSKTNPISSPKGISADKVHVPVSSPNSSAGIDASEVTQQDFFAGTELDMSLSTIPDEASSLATGVTMTSMSTAMSLDDRVFREGIAALDKNIAKVHEALQRTKKMFS